MDASSIASSSAQGAAKAAPLDTLLAALRDAIADRSLVSLLVSKNRRPGDDLKSVRARLIELRGAPALSIVYRHATRDVTKNLDPEAGLAAIEALLDAAAVPSFAHATVQLPGRGLQLMISRGGRQTLRRIAGSASPGDASFEAAASPALPAHDRSKPRALALELPFLVDLGITDERHRLIPSMARKWKQIDKFLEVLDGALDAAGRAVTAPLRVVDFGCGKGYLTFAVHEHLRRRFGVAPQVTGVELRADLVALCNRAAEGSRCGRREQHLLLATATRVRSSSRSSTRRRKAGDAHRAMRARSYDVKPQTHAPDATNRGLSDLFLLSRSRPAMAAPGVRREKAALSSGCKAHPATAPAGSNRSSHGGNEMAEAFG